MNALVTGANGFLGTYVVKELLQRNYTVKAMVRQQSDIASLTGLNCEIVHGDILDLSSLQKNFKGIDWVFHTAGAMSNSLKDKERLLQVNIHGVENVVTACRDQNVAKLIHVSSVVAIGASHTEHEVLNEDALNITKNLNFVNYDTKRQGEEIVLKAAREKGLFAMVVNPSLMYGALDAKKEIRKGNVQAAKGRLKFYTAGGVNIVAVEDVARGMVSAALQGRSGERYLLTGYNISVHDLLTQISKSAQAKPPHKLLSTKVLNRIAAINDFFGLKTLLTKENIFAATAFHWYDCTKAQKELGYTYGPWQAAIQRSVDWMKNNEKI